MSPRLLSASLGFLTLAGSLAALSPKAIAQNTVSYPAEAVDIFTKTCVAQGDPKKVPPEVMQAICACNIREIQKTYTLEEFIKIGTNLGQGKPASPEIQSMVEGCVVEVLNK